MVKQCRKGDVMSEQSVTYAVYYLVDQGLEPKNIAKKLDVSLKIVKGVIQSRPAEKNDAIKTTSAKVTSHDLMIRETSVKGTKNVAIMTKAASEVNDEFRKQQNTTVSRIAKNSIYRPNNKK